MTGKHDGRATLQDIFVVARDPELSAEELRLWLLIRSYEQADGRGAWPGDEVLASHMDRSPRSIQEYRAELLERGYLERELRGPNPAHWWAVVPKDPQQTANQGEESSEADCEPFSESRESTGEATTEDPRQTANQSQVSQEDSQKGPKLVSPDYGEYGEGTDTEGAESSPSLRSGDLSGEAESVENSEGGRRSDAALSGEELPTADELLDAGAGKIAANYLPATREWLFLGEEVPRRVEEKAVSVYRQWLKKDYGAVNILHAIRGFRHLVDTREVEWVDVGEPCGPWAMYDQRVGARSAFIAAADAGRKVAGDPDQMGESSQHRSGDRPTRIGDVQDPAALTREEEV